MSYWWAMQSKFKILERVVSCTPSSSHSIHTWVARLRTRNRNKRNWRWKMTSLTHCKLMSWFIHILIRLWSQSFLDGCRGFLVWVESANSDTVRLLASMAAIRCVFHQIATRSVKILLGKLAVGEITQTKQKQTFWHTHTNTFQTRIPGCSIIFLWKNKVCEISMFPKYLQTHYGIYDIVWSKKLQTAPLN